MSKLPDAHRLQGDDAAEADDRGLAGAAADVDDHVADRLVDRQVGADRRGHRLLDQLGVGRAGSARRVGDRPPLDLGDGRRHADDDLRTGEAADADSLQQQPDHPLGDLEVGDRPAAQRAHGDDVAGRAPDHLPRLAPGGQHLAGLAVEGDDRGLVEHDALALHVHERVRRAQVDRQVAGHQAGPGRRVVARRAARGRGPGPRAATRATGRRCACGSRRSPDPGAACGRRRTTWRRSRPRRRR